MSRVTEYQSIVVSDTKGIAKGKTFSKIPGIKETFTADSKKGISAAAFASGALEALKKSSKYVKYSADENGNIRRNKVAALNSLEQADPNNPSSAYSMVKGAISDLKEDDYQSILDKITKVGNYKPKKRKKGKKSSIDRNATARQKLSYANAVFFPEYRVVVSSTSKQWNVAAAFVNYVRGLDYDVEPLTGPKDADKIADLIDSEDTLKGINGAEVGMQMKCTETNSPFNVYYALATIRNVRKETEKEPKPEESKYTYDTKDPINRFLDKFFEINHLNYSLLDGDFSKEAFERAGRSKDSDERPLFVKVEAKPKKKGKGKEPFSTDDFSSTKKSYPRAMFLNQKDKEYGGKTFPCPRWKGSGILTFSVPNSHSEFAVELANQIYKAAVAYVNDPDGDTLYHNIINHRLAKARVSQKNRVEEIKYIADNEDIAVNTVKCIYKQQGKSYSDDFGGTKKTSRGKKLPKGSKRKLKT